MTIVQLLYLFSRGRLESVHILDGVEAKF